MSVEVTSKRLVNSVGDQLVITDVEITQTVLPLSVVFTDLLAEVKVEPDIGMVSIEYEGYETENFYDGEADIPAAKHQLALEIVDMLQADGVTVVGRPQ